ncbi:MAG: 50S ribosomal protein L10 [Acidimicrobiales bacterium]|nr:50S ribosomal protein L10 [Acidimicrobiales bacterium]
MINDKTPRPEKVAVVDEVRERLEGTSATILTEYRGLSVDQLAELRSSLRNIGGDFKVYKNTLVRFAARDLNLEIEDLLTGPTALAFVTDKPDGSPGDAVDVAKVLKDFGKDNPALVLKGGVLGENLLSADDTKALAEVEPREVLLAKLAGGMAAPMQKFAGLLQALPRNFAYGLKALIDQGGAPGAPADEPAPAAEEAPAEEPPAEEAAPAAEDDTSTDDTPAAEADTPETDNQTDEAPADEASEETQES